MDWQTTGELAKAVSAAIATLAFVWSLILWRRGERAKRILSWQQVIVLQIIQKKKSSFKEIKAEYLRSYQQLKDINVPKKNIQDSALMMVLMGLLEKKLIVVSWDGANRENVY